MKAVLSIVAGLVVGVLVAGLLLGGLLAFSPEPPPPSAADPSLAIPSSAPSATASVAPSASPSAAASVAPSAAAVPFHVGEPAPPSVVPRRPVTGRSTWRPSCPASTSRLDRRGHRRDRRSWRRRPARCSSWPTSTARWPRAHAIRVRPPSCPWRAGPSDDWRASAAGRPGAARRRRPDRPDRAGCRVAGPRRRPDLPRRSRPPVGDVPARRGSGPPRHDVPCRPRRLARTRRDPRPARAGGPRHAALAVRRAQGSVGRLPRPPGRRPRRGTRGRGRRHRDRRPRAAGARPRPLPRPARGRPPAADRGWQGRGIRATPRRACDPARSWRSATTSATRTGSASCARRAGSGSVEGLAVGVVGPHGMPDEVRAAADVVLATPFEAARALSALASALERETR